MPRDYVTETERVRRQLRETLTPRQKLANWWDYHKKHVLIAAAALAIVIYLAAQALRTPPPDYTVAWVCKTELDGRGAEDVADRFARLGEDLNGDGKVRVELHQMVLDLAALAARGGSPDGQREQGELMALEADLNICQSVIFLTDDPASLQACTGALIHLDGSQPAPDATDWQNLSLPWADCPALGDSPIEGALYLTCRGCWRDDQREAWSQSRELFGILRNDATTGEKIDE